jgi:hypothetical protein
MEYNSSSVTVTFWGLTHPSTLKYSNPNPRTKLTIPGYILMKGTTIMDNRYIRYEYWNWAGFKRVSGEKK